METAVHPDPERPIGGRPAAAAAVAELDELGEAYQPAIDRAVVSLHDRILAGRVLGTLADRVRTLHSSDICRVCRTTASRKRSRRRSGSSR